MSSKALLNAFGGLGLSLLSLTSCFAPKKASDPDTGFGFGFFKTEGAQKACLTNNLSQWSASAPFIHSFLRCASNASVDGRETLGGLHSLLDELDESKLQKVLDFVLSADPNAATHEERYPYLLALTTMLDRGLLEGRAAGLNLSTDRLENLQAFLLTLDSTRSKEILSRWSRSGRLAETLNEIGAFVDSMATYSVEVFTHELLAGTTLRSEALYLSRRILREDKLFLALNEVTNARPSEALSRSEQVRLLEPYRQTLARTDTQNLVALRPIVGAPTTPLEALRKEHSQLASEELNGLKEFILDFWRSYVNLPAAERDSLDSRLPKALDSLIRGQAHPIKWMLAFLQDVSELNAKDLDRATFAVDQLLLEGNNLSLEAIRAKAGASKLMDQLETLLTEGGAVPACPIFDAPPLALGAQDFSSFSRSLARLTVPQASCSGRVPMLAALQHFTGPELSLAFAPDLWQGQIAEPSLVRDLTFEAFDLLAEQSRNDPYRFYNLQLAVDGLSVDLIDSLSSRLKAHEDWSMPGLARLDEQLSRDFAGILEPDFLEKLLTYRIEALAAQTHEFKDLAPQVDAEIDASLEARSSRVFAGLYSGGPLEQLIAVRNEIARFPFGEDQQDLKNFFESHPSAWSRLLFKMREGEGAFRSPVLGGLAGESSTIFSGAGSSLRSYLGFTATDSRVRPMISPTVAGRILAPYQAIKPFANDAEGRSGWALWYQHYANGPLVSQDVPRELSGQLEKWLLGWCIPTVSDPGFWPELEPTGQFATAKSLSTHFFEIESYSTEEARLLASYYIKHYQKLSTRLPGRSDYELGKSSVPKNDLTPFAYPISGFLNASYLVKDDAESQYSTFAKNFPKALRETSKLSKLKMSVLPDYKELQRTRNPWTMNETSQVNDVTALPFDKESPFALLSALDLLTFAKPDKRFIPQPLVGFAGRLCRSKAKDPLDATLWVDEELACPIDFQGKTPEEAYGKFREYISQAAAEIFCPYLASDALGPKFIWSQRLGLTLDDAALCASRPGPSLMESYRFPEWHSARVLNDIFAMGRTATLKKGLAEIPSALRFYKIRAKGLEPIPEAREFLSLAKGVWSPKSALNQRRREFFAGSFWVGSPSLLNSYLNLVTQNVDPFAWRTALIAYAERDEKGEARDTLRAILREISVEQKLAAEAGRSAIYLGLKLAHKILGNPEFRAFTAHFIADINSTEAYDFYANELPLALVQLFPADQNPFDWADPGLSFLKNLAQHPFLRSWQITAETFSVSEMNRFLSQFDQALLRLGKLDESAKLLKKLADSILKLATLYSQEDDSHGVERWESLAQIWSRLDLGQFTQKQWTSLVTKLACPLQGLDGKDKLTGEAALQSFISALVMHGPSLAQAVQSAHQGGNPSGMDDPLFWPKWFRALLDPLETHDAGALALGGFIGEKRLAFSADNGALWLAFLRPGDPQRHAVEAIEAIDSVSEERWRGALTELTNLSSRLTRALGFLKTHMIWKVDPDHNAYRTALDQLYELSHDEDLRIKQIELITFWLAKDSQSKAD
jgi:hypothetical protein